MAKNKLYQVITEGLNTALLLFDRNLCLKYINPAGEMLFALSARRACGKSVAQLLPGAQAYIEGLKRALDDQHPFAERELQLRLHNATQVTVDSTVTPLSGRELLVELLRVDRHLRIAREENRLAQQSANRAVLRGLAHEINNPLGGLRGAAQLLERQLADETLKEYTAVIIGEAERLRKLLVRLLGPDTLPQKRAINIHEVLDRVRALVLAEISEGVRILCDYDPSIPALHADPDQLIQAVLNIARNATQALDGQGEIRLRTRIGRQFTIGQRRHKLVARIDIIDNGPGVPEALIESIFYPMLSGRPGGSGLGLSIAQSLVSRHGGLIECESRPGKTRFTLLLPIENGVAHG